MPRASPAEQVRKELLALVGPDGLLHATKARDWAESHPESALYRKAAEDYHCWDKQYHQKIIYDYQVDVFRTLIRMYVIDDDGDRETVSLSIDRHERKEYGLKGGFRVLDDVKVDRDLRQELHKDIEVELVRFRTKWATEEEFEDVWRAIDKMVRRRARARLKTVS